MFRISTCFFKKKGEWGWGGYLAFWFKIAQKVRKKSASFPKSC